MPESPDVDGGIQIVVGPGKAVEVIIPNIAVADLAAMADSFFMPDGDARGRLAALLAESPALTLTLTSKRTP